MGGREFDGWIEERDRDGNVILRSHRRRSSRLRRLAALAAGIGVIGGAFVGAQAIGRGDDVYDRPEGVELPPLPDDVAALGVSIAGEDGAILRSFLEILAPVLEEDAGPQTCTDALEALDGVGSPQRVFTAAEGIPDRSTADIAVRHVEAAARFLGECVEHGSLPNREEARFTHVILQRRLGQLA